jgi:hypothetical protein
MLKVRLSTSNVFKTAEQSGKRTGVGQGISDDADRRWQSRQLLILCSDHHSGLHTRPNDATNPTQKGFALDEEF